jgi:hypothetical protein
MRGRQPNDNIDKLLAFLKKIDAIHRRPDDKIFEPKKRDLSGRRRALFATRDKKGSLILKAI